MPKNSFRWPPAHPTLPNVLKSWGYAETNEPGDAKRTEADDFDLEPGKWQWSGSAWVPFAPPPPPPSPLTLALDAYLADPAAPLGKLKTIFQELRKTMT